MINAPFFADIFYNFNNSLKKLYHLEIKVTIFLSNILHTIMVLIISDKIWKLRKIQVISYWMFIFLMVNYFKKFSFLDDTVEDIFDLTNSSDISLFMWIKYILVHFSILQRW